MFRGIVVFLSVLSSLFSATHSVCEVERTDTQKAKEASQSISDYISSLITTAVNEKQENTETADDLKKWKGIIHLNKDWKEEKEDYLMNETPDDAESIS